MMVSSTLVRLLALIVPSLARNWHQAFGGIVTLILLLLVYRDTFAVVCFLVGLLRAIPSYSVLFSDSYPNVHHDMKWLLTRTDIVPTSIFVLFVCFVCVLEPVLLLTVIIGLILWSPYSPLHPITHSYIHALLFPDRTPISHLPSQPKLLNYQATIKSSTSRPTPLSAPPSKSPASPTSNKRGIFDLSHRVLNIDIPSTSTWGNLGYWKANDMNSHDIVGNLGSDGTARPSNSALSLNIPMLLRRSHRPVNLRRGQVSNKYDACHLDDIGKESSGQRYIVSAERLCHVLLEHAGLRPFNHTNSSITTHHSSHPSRTRISSLSTSSTRSSPSTSSSSSSSSSSTPSSPIGRDLNILSVGFGCGEQVLNEIEAASYTLALKQNTNSFSLLQPANTPPPPPPPSLAPPQVRYMGINLSEEQTLHAKKSLKSALRYMLMLNTPPSTDQVPLHKIPPLDTADTASTTHFPNLSIDATIDAGNDDPLISSASRRPIHRLYEFSPSPLSHSELYSSVPMDIAISALQSVNLSVGSATSLDIKAIQRHFSPPHRSPPSSLSTTSSGSTSEISCLHPNIEVIHVPDATSHPLSSCPSPPHGNPGDSTPISPSGFPSHLPCSTPKKSACLSHVLCLDAAYHFHPRSSFFTDVSKLLYPGGVLALTDLLLPKSICHGCSSTSSCPSTLSKVMKPASLLHSTSLSTSSHPSSLAFSTISSLFTLRGRISLCASLCSIPSQNLLCPHDYELILRHHGFDDVTITFIEDCVFPGFAQYVTQQYEYIGKMYQPLKWAKYALTGSVLAYIHKHKLLRYAIITARARNDSKTATSDTTTT